MKILKNLNQNQAMSIFNFSIIIENKKRRIEYSETTLYLFNNRPFT